MSILKSLKSRVEVWTTKYGLGWTGPDWTGPVHICFSEHQITLKILIKPGLWKWSQKRNLELLIMKHIIPGIKTDIRMYRAFILYYRYKIHSVPRAC